MKAFLPSPYIIGMAISKMPSKQYAISSTRVVSLVDAQLILMAIDAVVKFFSPEIISGGILVILSR
jgi:hypothetical protein